MLNFVWFLAHELIDIVLFSLQGKLKFVDKRLKKDKRAMKRVEKSKKKGRR